MASMKFKRNGILIHESKDGDILLSDPKFKVNTIIMAELLEKAKTDKNKAEILSRQFINFIKGHKQARWITAVNKIQKIKDIDKDFAKRLIKSLIKKDLRKIEKDIYFWEVENEGIEKRN